MVIRLEQDVFNTLKAKLNGNYTADEYVQAEATESGEVIGLPILVTEVAEAEKLVERIASIYANGGDIDPWNGPKDPYIVVAYDSKDTEFDSERCETLADAVCYMVKAVDFGRCAYMELCVDNNTLEAIYDVMRWPCAD